MKMMRMRKIKEPSQIRSMKKHIKSQMMKIT